MERFDRTRYRAGIALGAAANKAAVILMGTVMAVYVGRHGSPFTVSLVYTVFWAGLMVFSPIWGTVADVTGKRRTVLAGTAILATLESSEVANVDPNAGIRLYIVGLLTLIDIHWLK